MLELHGIGACAGKTEEWRRFSGAVERVLKGGESHAFA